MEIAFVSANKLRIELDSKQGNYTGRIYSYFLKYPSRFIGTMLVGNNIALVIYGIAMANAFEPLILNITSSEIAILLIQIIIATSLVLITAEFIPKTLFRINPNKVLRVFSIPALLVYYLLYPIVYVIIGLSEFILKKFLGVELIRERPAFGKVDLDNYLNESMPTQERPEEETEVQIFRNALDFSSVKLRDCMVPRTEIVSMNIDEPIESLKTAFIETGLSRILIYEKDIENIIGYAHSYEMFNKPETIRSILLPVSIFPETMTANELLKSFIKQQRSVAVVVDEFGGTSGIVTMEDVVEEIFGEIEDEHDKVELLEKKLNDKEYLLSARLEIDYLNEKYLLNLPESEEYETLSGLIIHHNESIPKLDEEIILGDFSFRITKVSDTRIDQVHMLLTDAVKRKG